MAHLEKDWSFEDSTLESAKYYKSDWENILIPLIVQDKILLKLIRRYLQSGVAIGGIIHMTEEGTPQGGPLSPLLSNIVLDELDKELEGRNLAFVRYADDCNIYVKSRKAAKRIMGSVTQFIEEKLKLKVNRNKSAYDRPWNRKVLGCSFTKK